MRSTLTPGPSSISYWVTVGPREKPTTRASMPKSVNTWVSWETTSSLASVRSLWGAPALSSLGDGSW